MEKMVGLRPLFRSVSSRSYGFAAAASTNRHHHHNIHRTVRTLFNLPSSQLSRNPNPLPSSSECRSPHSIGLGMRFYSEDVTHMPDIKDTELQNAFKDLMAETWNELPDSLIYDVKEALSKNTDDKSGKEVVANVFRAAEAVEEFGGIITTLKLDIDDSIGASGEDVKPLPDNMKNALHTIFDRYTTYLNSFGPDERYLRKKVETELGAKMIHLKMRCSGLGSEWGKVTVLGTSGLAGSYVEQRA
ncbi:succinate dehydrogenase subunit 5, mitochondrial isoform X2 [Gastrolobium bilobum]|uniref:succinate dehydrogenase subunit 5, mitochondrial isoform X2 n=1 Tax=Gastrolobium bilobum TaxID=150636 RepID=UPI002AB28288|nr:succinate dehydrogenase subunit 5, mitochondrial isoform X2 [Gastrolobium bilobum]